MPPPPSSAKALNAVLPLIASGQAYEAHQKARTFASRYSKAGQHDVAIDVLYQSSTELFKAGHLGSGTDLGAFILEIYDLKGEQVTDESRARMTQLISLVGSEGQWRKTLIDRSVAWSAKHSSYEIGDPVLHAFVGDLLYKEQDYPGAEPHLIAAGTRDSARTLANLLFAWSRNGADPGTYASKGVIPYLLAGNILAARVFLSHFLSQLIATKPTTLAKTSPISFSVTMSESSTSPSSSSTDEVYLTTEPTLNFLQLIVRVCQRAKNPPPQGRLGQEMWVRVCASYQNRRGLVANSLYREALGQISAIFFDLPPPRQVANNPLQDMMSSFLGGPPPSAKGPPKRTIQPPSANMILD